MLLQNQCRHHRTQQPSLNKIKFGFYKICFFIFGTRPKKPDEGQKDLALEPTAFSGKVTPCRFIGFEPFTAPQFNHKIRNLSILILSF
jgi:hypothetical protein